MLKKIQCYELTGIAFVLLLGIFLYFLYDLTGQSLLVGMFCPVNASVWEQLKLLFFPYFLFGLFEYFIYGEKLSYFFAAKYVGILFGLVFWVVAFYTYTGVIGKDFLWFDFLLFIFADALSFYISYQRITQADKQIRGLSMNLIAVVLLVLTLVFFVLFTFFAPHIHIFQNMTTNSYGLAI